MPQLIDLRLVRDRLEKDRPWTAFALADLEPPYSAFAKWFCPSDNPLSVALLYRAFSTPVLLFTGLSEEWSLVLREIDSEIDGAVDVYVVVRPDLLPLIRRHYSANEEKSMVRMVLEPAGHRSLISGTVSRIGPDDLDSLQRLYADEPPAFFLPSMLEDGVYYGVHEDGALVAAAGTHVVARGVGVAALGNIYTRPDRRGRGLATAVTAAVTGHLARLGIATIVLNVRDDNHAAIHVYERLGFRPYCNYFEVMATHRI